MINNTTKFFRIVSSLVLIILLFSPLAVRVQPTAARAHPALLQIAAKNPDQMVRVIIQKQIDSPSLKLALERSGADIIADLSIINAVAVEIDAFHAVQLSRRQDVRWVSLDAPVERSGKPGVNNTNDTTPTVNTYLDTLRVRQVWGMGLVGTGIGVAIIDSGISPSRDFSKIQTQVSLNPNSTTVNDVYGHGTHVAGIIAGNGAISAGKFQGVAPDATLFNLKVSDETGMSYESDVVAAMQWVYDNKAIYNIRIVNISLNSTVEQSYHTSPLAAACEILWFNGVVVVVSAGNKSSTTNYANTAPANDPFVITVGAADEASTTSYSDDTIATYSAWAITADGYRKPDIIAPGSNIISVLSAQSSWDDIAPERVVDGYYYRLSGTSMAAPMVASAAALLLQDEPNLTPDQVKYRILNGTARKLSFKVNKVTYSWPYLDVYAAVTGTTTASSNTGQLASQLLSTGTDPIVWGSVAWNSVAWNSVAWNSVAWNSVAWNSVAWNSAYWGQ